MSLTEQMDPNPVNWLSLADWLATVRYGWCCNCPDPAAFWEVAVNSKWARSHVANLLDFCPSLIDWRADRYRIYCARDATRKAEDSDGNERPGYSLQFGFGARSDTRRFILQHLDCILAAASARNLFRPGRFTTARDAFAAQIISTIWPLSFKSAYCWGKNWRLWW